MEYMKFCLIKRVVDDMYLCSQYEYGQDPNEYTFTAVGINASDCWYSIRETCREELIKLQIFENEEKAKRQIQRMHSRAPSHKQEEYVVILLADLDIDRATEDGLLS